MNDNTRDEEIFEALEREQALVNEDAKETPEKKEDEQGKNEDTREEAIATAVEEICEHDEPDEEPELDAEPVIEEIAEEAVEESANEKTGYYDDLISSDWELVLAAQEMEDKKKAAKEKAQEQRRKRQEKEKRRQAANRSQSESQYNRGGDITHSVAEGRAREDAEWLAKENERRRKEINEMHASEIRRKEEEYRKEIYDRADELRRRENASLGKTTKTSHLDLRAGANSQNLEEISFDRSSTYSENPSPMPDGVTAAPIQHCSESGGSEERKTHSAAKTNAESGHTARETTYEVGPQYTYGLNGSTETLRGASSWSVREGTSKRAEVVLEFGTGYADYTLNGIEVHPGASGKAGNSAPDKQVSRASVVSQPAQSRVEIQEPMKAQQHQLKVIETATARELIKASEDKNGIAPKCSEVKVVIDAVRQRNSLTQSTGKRESLGNNEKSPDANHSKSEILKKIEEATGVKVPDRSDNHTSSRDSAKATHSFDYYKARYSNTAYKLARTAVATPMALMMNIIEEGVRDGGADDAACVIRDSQTLALAAYYMSHENGNRLIAKATEGSGDFHTVRQLEKFDKEQIESLKQLRVERNQLLVAVHNEMGVGGNITPLLNSPENIDKILARTDLTLQCRESLTKLKENLIVTDATTTWLDGNARQISQFVDKRTLEKLGATSVSGLDVRSIEKLIALNKREFSQKMVALKKAVPADVFVELGGNSSKLFIKNMKTGKVMELLKKPGVKTGAEELARDAFEKLSAKDLLTRRKSIMLGKQNMRYAKMGRHMLGHSVGRHAQKFLRNTDEAGLAAACDLFEGVHNVRDAVKLSKMVGKNLYAGGKQASHNVKKAVDAGKQAVNFIGSNLIDKQIDKMTVEKFLPKPKPKPAISPRLVSNNDLLKHADVKKKATEAVKKAGSFAVNTIKVTASKTKVAAKAAVTGGKALVHGVVAAGQAAIPLLLTPVGLIIAGIVVAFILIIAIVLSVFCSDDETDVQKIVDKINNERDTVVLEGVYEAFKNETDPLGKPYGYSTMTGESSDNMTSGVTWEYENGISNDTAEIISLASVYFSQNWPSSSDIANLFSSDDRAFFTFCRDLAGYGLDVTAREGHPYSCLVKGGCVMGYHDNGQSVEIKQYRLVETETHRCSVGDVTCGSYNRRKQWIWNAGHALGRVDKESHVEEDGTRSIMVYFPTTLPDGANAKPELTSLPASYTMVANGGEIENISGNLVIDSNVYKGILDDWFFKPGELSASFTVVTHLENGFEARDTYTVSFGGGGDSVTAVPWCYGELNDGLHGHYDLTVTAYLIGYDEYKDPVLKPDDPANKEIPVDEDGIKGGTGNLPALAKAVDKRTLTRTVTKLNQWLQPYSGGTASRYTKTITLPDPDEGFSHFYNEAGEDDEGNVAWAKLLYSMDWEELYKVTTGIKCRSFGSKFSADEIEKILSGMNFDNISDARQKVVAVALASSGQFSYRLGGKPSGGAGNPTTGGSLDCSGFVKYCFWKAGLGFSATNTADYPRAGDLRQISVNELQPGDLQVMLSSDVGGAMGHVRIFLGLSDGKPMWAECVGSKGSLVNTWTNEQAGMFNCRYFTYTGF